MPIATAHPDPPKMVDVEKCFAIFFFLENSLQIIFEFWFWKVGNNSNFKKFILYEVLVFKHSATVVDSHIY
jgi:hypothetical protein